MQNRYIKYIMKTAALLTLWIGLSVNCVQATHIVGGDLTYRYLGNEQFEILLVIRRDCFLGSDEAEFDNPASVGVYDQNGNLLAGLPGIGSSILIPFDVTDTLNNRVVSDCGFEGEQVCVEETAYRRVVRLPRRAGGYFLGYNRCCRNGSIANIAEPLLTGASFYARVRESVYDQGNSSPFFDQWPEVYICANEPINFSSAATDPDGDSLVYELYIPFTGGTFDKPKPQPAVSLDFIPVQIAPPFSLNNLLGGFDPLRIDPTTGQISGTPTITGQFLVGVRVREFRDGVQIGSTNRDFQYNVRVCSPPPLAQFANPPVTCDGLTVTFENNSISASEYQWQFEFPSTAPATLSTEENPTYTYPAPGFYDIQMIATRGTDECADTSITRIGVFETDLMANFDLRLTSCTADGGELTVTSTAIEPDPTLTIVGYEYTFVQGSDTIRSSSADTTFTITNDPFTITQIVESSGGCTQDSTATLNVGDLLPRPVADWEIETCLIADSTFAITLTDIGVYSGVVQQVDWEVINGPQTETANGSSALVELSFQSTALITVSHTVTLANGCTGTSTFTIDPTTDIVSVIWLSDPASICMGDQVRLVANPNPDWTYTWAPTDGLSFLSAGDQSDPLFVGTTSRVYAVTVSDGACDFTDTILVEFVDQINIDVSGISTDCGGGILLTGSGGGNNDLYQWSSDRGFADTLFVGNPYATTVTDNDAVYYVRYANDSCVSTIDSIPASDVLAIADYTFDRIDCPHPDSVRLRFVDDSDNGSPGFVPVSWSWAISPLGGLPITGTDSSIEVVMPKNTALEVIIMVLFENGCTSTTIDTIVPGPYAAVDFVSEPAITLCTGDTSRIVANPNLSFSYTWEPTDGLVFDRGVADPLFVGNISTTYLVTVTDGVCTVVDSVVVELTDQLDIDVRGEQIDCEGTIVLTGVGGANSSFYEWSTDRDFDPLTFTGNPLQAVVDDLETVFYVRYTNGDCISAIDSIAAGDVIAQAGYLFEVTECPTDRDVTLLFSDDSGTSSPGFDPVSWSWEIGVIGDPQPFTTEQVTITLPKDSLIVVTLAVVYSNGCEAQVMDTIIPGPYATINFEAAVLQICTGDSIRIVTNPNSTFQYTWDPTDGLLFDSLPDTSNPLFVGTATQTYNVTVSDGICVVDTTVTVELVDQVDVTITGSPGVCDSDVELVASGALGAGDYQWSTDPLFATILFTGDTLRTTLPSDVTTYYLRYTGPDCNSAADSITLENKDIQLDWIEPFPICQGDNTIWQFFNGDTSQQLMFMWTPDPHITTGGNTGTPTITVGPEETENFDLAFFVENEFGCSLMDTITFTIDERPTLVFDYFVDTCGGTTICFDIVDSIDYNGFVIWNFGDLTTTDDRALGDSTCYTYPMPGTYDVSVWTAAASCASDTVTTTITVYPELVVEQLTTQTICNGATATITPSSNIEGTQYSYCTLAGVEIGSGAMIDITIVSDSSILVKGTAPDGCADTVIAVIDLYRFDPVVEIPEQVCIGQDTTISISSASGNDYSYQWGPAECIISGADTDMPRINVAAAKNISVTITDNGTGCIDSFSYPVAITSFTIEVAADPDAEINRGESVFIEVLDQEADWVYQWSNGSVDGSQEVMPDSTTTYTVTVTNEEGCIDIASLTIIVIQPTCDEDDIFLPTAFSPNGDDINDVWFVRGNFIESMELVVYNRWGEEVFYSNDQTIGWDGSFGGNTLAPDVFAYALSVICIADQGTYQVKGNVNLLR